MAAPPPRLSDRVARHYDVLDGYYRELWGEHLHHGLWERGDETVAEATEALVRRVAERARIGRAAAATSDGSARVLDLGSGYGATARWLATHLGARVTAVTVSPAQHAWASGRPPVDPPVEHRLGAFLDVDVPAGSFDAVVAIESLSHMEDLDATLAKVRAVLRPGGRFVACVWLGGDGSGPLRRRLLAEPIVREGRLARLAPAAHYRAAMERAGLRVEAFEDLSRQVRRTWWICVKGVAGRLVRDPEARRLVSAGGEGVFAWTVPRLLVAYRAGALRYGLFTCRRPPGGEDASPAVGSGDPDAGVTAP